MLNFDGVQYSSVVSSRLKGALTLLTCIDTHEIGYMSATVAVNEAKCDSNTE